ncbi:MAG: hypothetical protein AB8H86_03085 [Polyangiales bacterium]
MLYAPRSLALRTRHDVDGEELRGSCGGSSGPEQVFAFEVPVESEFSGVYYVRSRCQDSTSEHFCGGFGTVSAWMRPKATTQTVTYRRGPMFLS